MNKKVNTLLFMLAATLMNIILMIVLLLSLIAVVGMLVPEPSSGTGQILLVGVFLLSLGGSFGIYTLIMKAFTKRVDMDKYFHPIFKSKHPPRK